MVRCWVGGGGGLTAGQGVRGHIEAGRQGEGRSHQRGPVWPSHTPWPLSGTLACGRNSVLGWG